MASLYSFYLRVFNILGLEYIGNIFHSFHNCKVWPKEQFLIEIGKPFQSSLNQECIITSVTVIPYLGLTVIKRLSRSPSSSDTPSAKSISSASLGWEWGKGMGDRRVPEPRGTGVVVCKPLTRDLVWMEKLRTSSQDCFWPCVCVWGMAWVYTGIQIVCGHRPTHTQPRMHTHAHTPTHAHTFKQEERI